MSCNKFRIGDIAKITLGTSEGGKSVSAIRHEGKIVTISGYEYGYYRLEELDGLWDGNLLEPPTEEDAVKHYKKEIIKNVETIADCFSKIVSICESASSNISDVDTYAKFTFDWLGKEWFMDTDIQDATVMVCEWLNALEDNK